MPMRQIRHLSVINYSLSLQKCEGSYDFSFRNLLRERNQKPSPPYTCESGSEGFRSHHLNSFCIRAISICAARKRPASLVPDFLTFLLLQLAVCDLREHFVSQGDTDTWLRVFKLLFHAPSKVSGTSSVKISENCQAAPHGCCRLSHLIDNCPVKNVMR